MKQFIPWFVGALVLGACDKANDAVAPSVDHFSAAVVRLFDEDFRGEFATTLEGCNGDLIPLIGKFSGHFNVQVNNGDRLHAEFHLTTTAQGVGEPSGLKYNFTDASSFTQNFLATAFTSETFTSVENFHLNAEGSALDLRGHFLFHYTFNANGELTAFVDNFVVECK